MTLPHNGPRPSAVSTKAMVSSAHPLATRAGVEILKMGGNAFDAAIAVAFCLDLVESDQSSAITGDGFGHFFLADTREHLTADWSSRTPLSPELKRRIKEIEDPLGPLSLQAPTGIAGHLSVHERFGSLPLEQVLAPAIRLAENGFPVDERLHLAISKRVDIFAGHPFTAKSFLLDGAAPPVGHIMTCPELAQTMRRLAAGGKEEFYRGGLSKEILAFVEGFGGILTQDDLDAASAAPIWSKPLHIDYRGYTISSVAPAAGGIPLLEAMNILEGYDFANMSDAQRHHVMAEVFKIVLVDMDTYFGDPDVDLIPRDILISKQFAADRRRLIKLGGVLPWSLPRIGTPAHHSGNTSHLNVVDHLGNVAAVTQTRSDWGIKIPVGNTGFFLHNGIRLLSTDPAHPMYAGVPGKRLQKSISPTIVSDADGNPIMSVGAAGIRTITQTIAQTIVHHIDLRMDPQEAIDAPRLSYENMGNKVNTSRVSPDTTAALSALGHDVTPGGLGKVQAITIDPATGVLKGGADVGGSAEGL